MSLFTCYSLITFVCFLKKWPTTIPSKKYDKLGKNLLIKKKGQEKKKRERAIEKDRNRFINKNIGTLNVHELF